MLSANSDNPPDVVFVDPLLAYIGGDVCKQEVASAFLRNGLNPIIHRHNIGLVIVHHTSKPSKEAPRAAMNGDAAYLGTGSADLANWARAVLCIQAVAGSNTVYRLQAGKRGKRLGWAGQDGTPELSRFIAHSPVPRRICWIPPSDGDIPEEIEPVRPGRKQKSVKQLATQAFDIINQSGDKWLRVTSFKAEVASRLSIGEKAVNSAMAYLLGEHRLEKRSLKTSERYDIIGLPGVTENARAAIMAAHQNPELLTT
jgi:hypothetical protein